MDTIENLYKSTGTNGRTLKPWHARPNTTQKMPGELGRSNRINWNIINGLESWIPTLEPENKTDCCCSIRVLTNLGHARHQSTGHFGWADFVILVIEVGWYANFTFAPRTKTLHARKSAEKSSTSFPRKRLLTLLKVRQVVKDQRRRLCLPSPTIK